MRAICSEFLVKEEKPPKYKFIFSYLLVLFSPKSYWGLKRLNKGSKDVLNEKAGQVAVSGQNEEAKDESEGSHLCSSGWECPLPAAPQAEA